MTYQSSQFRGNFLVMLQYAKITSFACWLYRWDMLVHFILAHVSLLYLQPQVSKPLMFHIWFKLLHLVQPAIRHIKTSVISSSSSISLQSEHQSTCWSWLFNYPEKKLSIKHPPNMRCVVIQRTRWCHHFHLQIPDWSWSSHRTGWVALQQSHTWDYFPITVVPSL